MKILFNKFIKIIKNVKNIFQRKCFPQTNLNQRGQIILEYVLLLIIALTAAITVNNMLIKSDSNPKDMGFLRKEWYNILVEIGKDIPDPKP